MTPTLSVEAVHVRLIWLDEIADAERFVGVEGAVVSPAAACVVALGVFELAETLPAASMARTVYDYAVEAVRPVSEYEVPLGVPTCVPLRKTR